MTIGARRRRGGVGRGVLLVALWLVAQAAAAAAQARDSIPGVTLGLVYETAFAAGFAVKPFTGRFGGEGVAAQVEAIVGRDLRYADRFSVMDSLPAALLGEGIDYTLWDRLGAVWLVTGQVEGSGGGYTLVLELHDVVYGRIKEQGRFRLPDPANEDFRMAVHRASDQIVQWATGEPGMAASRIAFSLTTEQGNKELYLIDSDGENLRRITNNNTLSLSPAWHPSGTKIAYASDKGGENWRVYELDLLTRREKALPALRDGGYMTPEYAPDGQTLAFSVGGGTNSGLFTYNLERNCCLAHLSGGPRWDDLSPSYSPDGSRMVFQTNRFGTQVPQIMIMPAHGGEAETISPYEFGKSGFYAAPEWSPVGDLVAFHGSIRRGTYHILVADLRRGSRRLRQLTWEGNNEDPSWAPDGRHLVFIGERRWGYGLFVVDVATGQLRTLLEGRRVTVPSWSPALRPPG
jgi:TolB protein